MIEVKSNDIAFQALFNSYCHLLKEKELLVLEVQELKKDLNACMSVSSAILMEKEGLSCQ